jgi:hypothetical protein
MRESRRRSLARLYPLAMLLIAACAPLPGLDNLGPPCAPHFQLCMATGYCIPQSDGSIGSDASAGYLGGCLQAYQARQGSTDPVLIPVPFGGVDDITVEVTSPDGTSSTQVTAKPVRLNGAVSVSVLADHGALGGYVVTIRTKGAPDDTKRLVEVDVSAIVVAAGGDDKNAGTLASPFATIQKAVSVANGQDTIELFGETGNDNIVFHDGVNPNAPLSFQDGLTVIGLGMSPSPLWMPIILEGSASLTNVYVEASRLVVTKPGGDLELSQSLVAGGVTLDKLAGATGPNDLHPIFHAISCEIRNDNQTMDPPVLIEAVGANVKIENEDDVMIVRSGANTVPAILFEGGGQTLDISGSGKTVIDYQGAVPAIRLAGPETSLTINNVELNGRIEIPAASSMADIEGGSFNFSDSNGAIIFGGNALTVRVSTFTGGLAVVQTNGSALIRNTTISGYSQIGYDLKGGLLDLGTSDDPGNNSFTDMAPASGSLSQPTAIVIESTTAIPTSNPNAATVTASATTFDSASPGQCHLTYPPNGMSFPGIPGVVMLTKDGETVNFY